MATVVNNLAPLMQSARTAAGRKSGSTDNWSTPPDLYDWLLREFRVTIDPCCGPESANSGKVARWDGERPELDGLLQPWTPGYDSSNPRQVAFVNPPYSQFLQWAQKAIDELTDLGDLDEAIFFVPARTDTKAFRLIASQAYKIWFFPKRLRFVQAGTASKDTAPFPSALVWLKRRPFTPTVYFADPRETGITDEDREV